VKELGRLPLFRYTCRMVTTLIHVDHDKHMDRRYTVAVQPTLLDPVAVVCVWGSRRGRYQRLRVLPAASAQEGHQLADRIVQQKVRRGYVLAS
jgi:predicted DNA-binding WGR domain protein